jgi:pyruvate dehydrogenase phosphatase
MLIMQEARRIRNEHPDDPGCIVNGRVKGSLKVTRAFGAGYLKEPRWNKALLEVFRVNYVGTSPYISCRPYLRHHRVGPRDKFMILASDGLYDYLSNEEVVAQVEAFTGSYPDEDPAKYLSHEILLRAANQAGE